MLSASEHVQTPPPTPATLCYSLEQYNVATACIAFVLKSVFFIQLLTENIFSGKMFQAPDLTLIVEFIFMFYKEKPIDWLLDHILWVKVCNPEKDAVS